MSSQFWAVRDAPWEELSDDEKPASIDEAIKLTGLDWTIQPKPVYYLDNPEAEEDDTLPLEVQPVTNHFANVRSDNGEALGIVTKRYVHLDNIEAFAFLSEIFQTEMNYVTAGEFMGGRRVFVVMKLPDFIEVGGDPIGQYAFVHNSHDGKHAVSVGMTPIRWICQNMVTANLRIARRTGRFISIQHSSRMEQRIQEAHKMLDVTVNYYKQFKELGDKLATKKISGKDLDFFTAALLPVDEEEMKERQLNNRLEARQQIIQIFKGKGEGGNTEGNSPGTWWAAYNAAIEFADWYRPERKKGGRLQRAFDDPDSFKTNAFEMALTGAGL